jgi:ATP-binding cassette subfamily C protein/ATP-binding cassette subfamily C protein EexD
MMQVFDRVLGARSLDTLLWLHAHRGGGGGLLALLDACRAQVMGRIAAWVEARVVPEGFMRALEATLVGRPYRMEALRDLSICRAWLAGPGALALFDVPWVPIYLGVIFLLHPLMGWIALAGAVALFALTMLGEVLTAKPLKEATTASIAAQRKADAIARNAEVAEHDGDGARPDAPLARGRGGERAAAGAGGEHGGGARGHHEVRAAGPAARGARRRRLARAAERADGRRLDRGVHHHGARARAGGDAHRVLEGAGAGPAGAVAAAGNDVPPPPASRRAADGRADGALHGGASGLGAPGRAADRQGRVLRTGAGEVLSIIGPSAAGKSTLLRLLVGALPPANGASRWMVPTCSAPTGRRSDPTSATCLRTSSCSTAAVFQNVSRLRPDATIEEAHEAARLAGLPRGDPAAAGRLRDRHRRERRAALGRAEADGRARARALRQSPKLVVLDEPDSSLDGDAEARLIAGIGRLRTIGLDRDPRLAPARARRGLRQGAAAADGAVEAFGPRAEVLAKLGPRPVPRAAPPAGPLLPAPKSMAAE